MTALSAASLRRIRLALLVLVGFALGGLAAVALVPQLRARLLPASGTGAVGQALIGGPFTLTDHTGRRVSDADFRGKFMLVLFGFTYCPDVCPSSLQVMAAALDRLGPKAERIVPILITVDPERDTPRQLAAYVASFHPRLIGLTGSPAEVEAAQKAYRVYVRKVPDPKSTAGYNLDHSAFVYLMGPDGTYRTHFGPATSLDAMADRLARIVQ